MKELINRVTIIGKLVKNNIEEFQTKKGEEAIGGSLILRTSDNSEHEIRFFAYKFKKDENKNFTTEESYFYQKYMDAKENLRDIEHCSENENPYSSNFPDRNDKRSSILLSFFPVFSLFKINQNH